jgi:osmotically-inducible protein OsmY
MAYRDRDRDRDREEFRGGADEYGSRSQSGSYGRGFEEGRAQQFGREHENFGRESREFGREHELGGRNPSWQPSGSYESSRGYSGESGGYGSQREFGSQAGQRFGSQGSQGFQSGAQRYGSQGYGSQGFGSQGYQGGSYGSQGYGSGSQTFGSEGRARSSWEGADRESGWGGSMGGYGRSQFREGSEGFGSRGYGQSFGYLEGQFGTSGRTRGRFTGRGPKNYTRSDERIREDVSDRLEQHGDIDAGEVVVIVEAAEVTLEGTVPDRQTKRLAEDVAEDTPGVKQVHNRLRVQGNGDERQRQLTGSTASSTSSTAGTFEGSERSKSGSTTKSSSRT